MEPADVAALEAACAAPAASPFGTPVRLQLVLGAAKDGKKLGTYGFIKNAQAYLVGAVTRGEHDLEDYGYVFERLILEATALGLGTCWLGGTLDRGAFGQTVQLSDDEWLPAVTPVGPTTAKRGLVDGAVRMFAGSRKRLDFGGRILSPGQYLGHRGGQFQLSQGKFHQAVVAFASGLSRVGSPVPFEIQFAHEFLKLASMLF